MSKKKMKNKGSKSKKPECDLFMAIEGTHFGHIFIPESEREEFIDMIMDLPYSEHNKRISIIVQN